MSEELIPSDPHCCQAEIGGAFVLGPGRVRCKNKPAVIVGYRPPRKGSMSLCEGCLAVFQRQRGTADYIFTDIEE